jgi:muconolactone delta-isomerase
MRISDTLELNIPDDIDINKLERYLAKEIERSGKQVFEKVLQEIETKKLESEGP